MKRVMIHSKADFGSEFRVDGVVCFVCYHEVTWSHYIIVQKNRLRLQLDYREQGWIKDGHSRKKKYDTDNASHTFSDLLVAFFLDFLDGFCILPEIAASWKG